MPKMPGLNNRPPPAYSDTAHTSPAGGNDRSRSLLNKNNTAHHWYDDIELSDLLSDSEEEDKTPASPKNTNRVQPAAKSTTGCAAAGSTGGGLPNPPPKTGHHSFLRAPIITPAAARVVNGINARVAPAAAPATLSSSATPPRATNVDVDVDLEAAANNRRRRKTKKMDASEVCGGILGFILVGIVVALLVYVVAELYLVSYPPL
ncbi:hypothetical protein GE09DRAFT_303161 [Coniochaeta sp. 2T2.1]|nr:hypothetical protein GE09DRAFT_303161 [Coniochaeta sp. 2T2.1]